jgi:hypothetical protein
MALVRPNRQQIATFTGMHFADSLTAFTNKIAVLRFHITFSDKYNFQASIIAIIYCTHSSYYE